LHYLHTDKFGGAAEGTPESVLDAYHPLDSKCFWVANLRISMGKWRGGGTCPHTQLRKAGAPLVCARLCAKGAPLLFRFEKGRH
jgi:hypothetical protein